MSCSEVLKCLFIITSACLLVGDKNEILDYSELDPASDQEVTGGIGINLDLTCNNFINSINGIIKYFTGSLFCKDGQEDYSVEPCMETCYIREVFRNFKILLF